MLSTMMGLPLTTSQLLDHAESLHGTTAIVSRRPDDSLHRYTYSDMARRSRHLAASLVKAGVQPGDRVATLMWNHWAHLEAYFGVPAAGAVLHTLNLRLHPEDIGWIAADGGAKVLLVDDVLLPLYRDFADAAGFEQVIVFSFDGQAHEYSDYEDFIAGHDGASLPVIEDEQAACGLCYTSGTTGKPKGVAYSHRSTVLHALGFSLPDSAGLSMADAVMPVVPMFHAMAWGLPYAATLVGAKQVLPGRQLDAEPLLDLAAEERVSFSGGVPTIWMRIIDALEAEPARWPLREGLRMFVGGSATPPSLIERFDRFGINVQAVWGMTETSPIGSVSVLRPELADADEAVQRRYRCKAGLALPLVGVRHVNEAGEVLPRDGESVGELQVRGPWITGSYFQRPDAADSFADDGWFRTGDVVTVGADGYISIADRAKDLIKSGGEWISSVELENALMGCDGVAEAVVIAVPDDTWMERPLAILVARDKQPPSKSQLQSALAAQFAKWWLPEDYIFVDAIPKTATGKFMKRELRERYADWKAGAA